jgi:type II secretory pathway pseudopilin PulG
MTIVYDGCTLRPRMEVEPVMLKADFGSPSMSRLNRFSELEFSPSRKAFTLIELLIVLSVIIIVGVITVRAVTSLRGSGVDSGSRVLQATLGKFRARAAQGRASCGVVATTADMQLVDSFEAVREIRQQLSSEDNDRNILFLVELRRLDEEPPISDFDADSPAVVLVAAMVSHQWEELERTGCFGTGSTRVRIPSGPDGSWYQLRPVRDGSDQLVESDGDWSVIRVQNPLDDTNLLPFPLVVAGNTNSGASSLDLEFTTEPVPFSEPISLPAGVVIDLEWSSQSVRSLAEQNGAVQLMFSPRGNLVGPAGSLGALHFLLTDRQDAELLDDIDAYNNTTGRRKPDGLPDVPRRRRSPIDPRNRYPKTIVSVIPQSGAVLTSPIDPTDLIDNVTGESGPDGLADDLFRFARTGAGGP